jgi:hypothetical protein
MTRTLDDLRGALHDAADAAAYPDVDALVAGARRRVAASRRRRLAVFGAVTAAVLVVGGLAVSRPAHKALPQPADPGPFTVNAGGADFPQYQHGMKRLTVMDAPMLARAKGSIVVATHAGRHLVVRMTCTQNGNMDNVNDWDVRMFATFTALGVPARTPCSTTTGFLYDVIDLGVATAAKTTVLADVSFEQRPPLKPGLFTGAKIHVALYETVPWQDYPLPARPTDLNTNAQYAWTNEPGTVRVLGPKTAQEANKPLTFTQPFDPKLSLNLGVRGPGQIRVLLDGVDVSEQVSGFWLTPDKLISFWGYDGTMSIGLPVDTAALNASAVAPTPRAPGTPMTVTIVPQNFKGPDWRIVVQPSPPSS